jgi:multiple sugar transport system substrate-binding protein
MTPGPDPIRRNVDVQRLLRLYDTMVRIRAFEEAGLDPESPPTNYDEFETAANTITENTDKLAFNPEPYGAPYNYMFTAWVKAAGGEFLNEDKTAAAFDSEAGHSVGQFYHDIPANGWDEADSSSMRGIKAFRNGDLAMTLNGTWFQLVLRDLDLDWGHAKPWVLPDMERKLTWGDTHIINVPRQSGLSDSEIQTRVDAAEWLTQEGTIWATEAGHIPTLDGATEQLQDTEVWDLTLKNYVEMVNDDQIAYWPVVENRDDYTRPVDQNVAQIYSHQTEPEEAITQAAQQVTDNLQS